MAKNSNKHKTELEKEIIKSYKKVLDYKTICEANIVSLLWKNPDFFYSYDKINLDTINNNMWKVYFQIAKDIIVKERKTLDKVTVNLYLEKHPKLKDKYEEYGGFEKINDTFEYVKESNMAAYSDELFKWSAVLTLIKRKFPIYDRIKSFVDMNAEDIYKEYEAVLNHVFTNVESGVKSYSLIDGIEELIDELDSGIGVGMPYDSMPMLTKELGGMRKGEISLVGGISGSGKSTLLRNTIIPSCIKYNEKVVFILNEETNKKVQSEMLIWIANNIYKEDLQKYTIRDGKFKPEIRELLLKCAKWLKEKIEKETITIIPLGNYTTPKAIKVIRKYSSMGVNNFVIDTFKADADIGSNNPVTYMPKQMVALFDTVKEENKNVHLSVIFQTTKGSSRIRYLSIDNIGNFKNIVDPASSCFMFRPMYEDEYTGEKMELKIFRMDGKKGKTMIPVKTEKNKHYSIIFISKNRNGMANDRQIVVEIDLSRNTMKEIGLCNVSMDY